MGTVYKAEQIYLKKPCALKILSSGGSSESALDRFKHEAHAASALEHPNLIKVQDFGLIDDRQPFLVMELAEGLQLSQIIKSKGHLDIETACTLFVHVCKGLEYAHSKGVVHRDIKPDNIIIDKVDQPQSMVVKIIDFGIAKHNIGEIPSALTKTGELFGTPAYMSPEQCLGQTVDDRSDIYSVGCVLYEALTGTPPFVANTALATMWKQQNDNPPTLIEGSLGLEFPPDLERIVAKMLRKDLRNRYSNIGQVADDLEAVVQNRPTSLGYEVMEERLAEQTKNAKLGQSKGFTIARNMVLATCLVALGLIVGVGLTMSRNAKTNASVQTKTEDVNQIDTAHLKNYVPESMPVAPKNFSYQLPLSAGFRLFDFGESDLGTIDGIEDNVPAIVLADGKTTSTPTPKMVGRMFICKSFCVHANGPLISNSSYFKAFKPEDVRGIRMDAAIASVDNEFLRNIQHLSKLDMLRIKVDNNLSETSLPLLNRFENLKDFSLKCSPSQKIDWLANLTRLKELKAFELLHAQNCKKILELLHGSKAIQSLSLVGCGIDTQAMTDLAQMKTIVQLDLNGNQIQDSDLELLRTLPTLFVLDITNCPKLTANAAVYLKDLPVQFLAISSFGSPALDDAFRKKLSPSLKIDFTSAAKRRMDNADINLLLGTPTK